MNENLILVNYKVESEAYQALATTMTFSFRLDICEPSFHPYYLKKRSNSQMYKSQKSATASKKEGAFGDSNKGESSPNNATKTDGKRTTTNEA